MSTAAVHPTMYVLLGPPGSGKGTFSQAIASDGYDHISTGDITRQEVINQTPFGLKYEKAITGHVVGGIPYNEIQALVEKRLEKALAENRGVILDGYPKTLDQCKDLDAFIEKNQLSGKVVIVLFNVDEEAVIERILWRQTCQKCGKIYNLKFSSSKVQDQCDEPCSGALTKRLDDNVEGTQKRVREFKDKMRPVINYYKDSSRLNELDASAPPDVCLQNYVHFHRLQKLTKV
jgi:adenylate kinase